MMSLVNYFREHCGMDFADKTQSINKLLKKDAQFIWTDEQQRAFESIVQSIMENQKLYWLDYEKKIYFRCDASKIGCGAQLFQHSESGNELPIAHAVADCLSRLRTHATRTQSRSTGRVFC